MPTEREIIDLCIKDIEADNLVPGRMGNVGEIRGCAMGLVFKNSSMDKELSEGHARTWPDDSYVDAIEWKDEALNVVDALAKYADSFVADHAGQDSPSIVVEYNDGVLFQGVEDAPDKAKAIEWFTEAREYV